MAMPKTRFPQHQDCLKEAALIVHPQLKASKPRLGPFLRRQRKKAGMSLRDVKRRAEIEPAALSRIENSSRLPTTETLMKVAKVLQLDMNTLLRFTKHDTNLKKKRTLK